MIYNYMSFALVKANVICTESTMTVEVDRSSLPRLHEDHLRLTDSTNIACNISSNNTHFYAIIPLNACGTQIEVKLWSSPSVTTAAFSFYLQNKG